MNFQDIRESVLGCISRCHHSLDTGNTSFVDLSINNSLIFLQRKIDFEWNKKTVKVHCNPMGSIMEAADFYSGEKVKIKSIIKAFGEIVPTGHGDTAIPYLSRACQINDEGKSPCFQGELKVVHEGQKLYLSPTDKKSYDLYFYAVTWLPKLCRPEDTNFLLEYGSDFILYKTIENLNYFIKEDERFGITQKLIDDSLLSLRQWDASLISPTETEIDL